MRRNLDQYFTPAFATRGLLEFHNDIVGGHVLECCSGKNDIADELHVQGGLVITNDIDPLLPSHLHDDATDSVTWEKHAGTPWIVSNTPFNVAPKIVPLAYEAAETGIAMLLRLSYLEPCKDRAEWLKAHPVSHLIVLPRISFTGDGKTDNCTCAWMVWLKKGLSWSQRITVVTKADAARWS